MSFLPTKLPVQFFGMPNGKVYIVYARFYEIKFNKSDLEYVFAVHEEFLYDYDKEIFIPIYSTNYQIPFYSGIIDKPEPLFKIIQVYRNISSFSEAIVLLNIKAEKMLHKQPE